MGDGFRFKVGFPALGLGLEFRVWGVGFRAWGLGLGFRVLVEGLGP